MTDPAANARTVQPLIEAVEDLPCPSCGRKTLQYWADIEGAGGQCTSLDCLQMFETDELELPQ